MADDNQQEQDKKAAFTFVRIPLVILVGLVILAGVYFLILR